MTAFKAWAKTKTADKNNNEFQSDSQVLGFKPAIPAANDDALFQELESRYGAAFAQWIMDDLRRASIL